MQGVPILLIPAPALDVLDARQGGGGKDHVLPGPLVHHVVCVTEVAHRDKVTCGYHLPVVEGGGQVDVEDLEGLVPPTAHNAGGGLPDGAHLLSHDEAVVGGHDVQLGSRK